MIKNLAIVPYPAKDNILFPILVQNVTFRLGCDKSYYNVLALLSDSARIAGTYSKTKFVKTKMPDNGPETRSMFRMHGMRL